MIAQIVQTIAEAKASGQKRYFTGEPCPHGHVAERFVTSRNCVECARLRAARIRAEMPDVVRARARAWRERHPEAARASDRASWRRRYEANAEKFRAISRAFREKHPEKARAWAQAASSAWKAANRDAVAAFQRNRRAMKRASAGTHTTAEIRALALKQKHRCAACNTNIRRGFHADHIIPLSKGGGNSIRNIQLLCAPCNLKKGAKHPVEFAQANGRLL